VWRQVASGDASSSSQGGGGDAAVKLMLFDAVNVRAVLHSSLNDDDVERAVDKVRIVLRQLRDWCSFTRSRSCMPTTQPVCLRAPAVTNWMILSEQRFHLLTVTASKAFGWEKTLEFSAPSAYSLLPNSRRQPDPTKLLRRSAVRIEQLLGRVQTSNFPYATVLNSHWESKSHRRCDSSVGSGLVMWIRQTLVNSMNSYFLQHCSVWQRSLILAKKRQWSHW